MIKIDLNFLQNLKNLIKKKDKPVENIKQEFKLLKKYNTYKPYTGLRVIESVDQYGNKLITIYTEPMDIDEPFSMED